MTTSPSQPSEKRPRTLGIPDRSMAHEAFSGKGAGVKLDDDYAEVIAVGGSAVIVRFIGERGGYQVGKIPFAKGTSALDREVVNLANAKARFARVLPHAPRLSQMKLDLRDGMAPMTVSVLLMDSAGGSVRDHLDAGRMRPDEVAEIGLQIADWSHRSGLVHRDIKPENILIDAHKHATVADLGSAVEAGSMHPPGEGVSWRTCAPEAIGLSLVDAHGDVVDAQSQALVKSNPKHDVYSLWSTAAEALSGRGFRVLPEGASHAEIMKIVASDTGYRELPADVVHRREWQLAIMAGTEMDPQKRSDMALSQAHLYLLGDDRSRDAVRAQDLPGMAEALSRAYEDPRLGMYRTLNAAAAEALAKDDRLPAQVRSALRGMAKGHEARIAEQHAGRDPAEVAFQARFQQQKQHLGSLVREVRGYAAEFQAARDKSVTSPTYSGHSRVVPDPTQGRRDARPQAPEPPEPDQAPKRITTHSR